VTTFGSAAKHEANEPFCVSTITESEGDYKHLSLSDTTNDHLGLTGTVTNIEVHRQSPTGSILCEEATTESGVMHVDVTISGRNPEGNPTPIGLHH